MFVFLFVSLMNVKMAKPIESKFFCDNSHDFREGLWMVEREKISCNKCRLNFFTKKKTSSA